MLSSKPLDIAGGFHLMVPVADYFSVKRRTPGVGVSPDIPVDAGHVLDIALGR
jgi:carboxyl-terminal processing protease